MPALCASVGDSPRLFQQEQSKRRQRAQRVNQSLFQQKEKERAWRLRLQLRQKDQWSLQELQQEDSKREKERAWRQRLRLQLHQKDQSSLQEIQQEECSASYVTNISISLMQAS